MVATLATARVQNTESSLSPSVLKTIENCNHSAADLALALFCRLFKTDLDTCPDQICVTDKRAGEKELCNQEWMRAIRCK